MSILRVEAKCQCDGCGKPFTIELDAGTEPMDFEALAKETINGGTVGYDYRVRGKTTIDREPQDYQPTIQADMMLCGTCSKTLDNDETFGEAGPQTREQVERILKIITD